MVDEGICMLTNFKLSSHRRPWDDSDDEREKPDYYSGSSDMESDDPSAACPTSEFHAIVLMGLMIVSACAKENLDVSLV